MEELEQLYGAYLDLVAQLNRNRKLWDGAFGLGGGPADNPCHEKLVRDVEAALADLDPTRRPQAVEYILRQPLEHKVDPVVYYTLMAAQGATIPYLSALPVVQAKALRGWFEQTFPRRERMPCQDKVLAALKKVK